MNESAYKNKKPFLEILAGGKTKHVPVWFMRQAGRYLPEYRELRSKKNGFFDMAFDPQAAAEITVQPIRRFGMDATILFSDILTIPLALGQHVEFLPGVGPKLEPFNQDALNLEKFHERLEPVYEAVRETRSVLANEGFKNTALIGFAGAPWTVATYMIEGGSSKDFSIVKSFAYGQPEKFKQLMDLLVEATAQYLIKQIEAGAEAVQIFDSWAGALDPHGFQFQSIEPTKQIVTKIRAVYPDIPIIGFAKGAAMHTPAYAKQTGITAVGLDSLMCTKYAAANLQSLMPVQGNLDPMRVLAGGEGLDKAVRKILKDFSRNGEGGRHIFNLGHGINKNTPVEHVQRVVDIIRQG